MDQDLASETNVLPPDSTADAGILPYRDCVKGDVNDPIQHELTAVELTYAQLIAPQLPPQILRAVALGAMLSGLTMLLTAINWWNSYTTMTRTFPQFSAASIFCYRLYLWTNMWAGLVVGLAMFVASVRVMQFGSFHFAMLRRCAKLTCCTLALTYALYLLSFRQRPSDDHVLYLVLTVLTRLASGLAVPMIVILLPSPGAD